MSTVIYKQGAHKYTLLSEDALGVAEQTIHSLVMKNVENHRECDHF